MINNRNGHGVNIKRIMPGDFIHPVGPVLTGEAWLPVEEKIKGRVFSVTSKEDALRSSSSM